MKSFCIELFVIALTVNMNEIETQKNNNDKDKVREAEIKLANGFLLLADLLQDDLGVCRECVLTAFSLNPTENILERIKALAVACGKCAPDEDRVCLSSFDDSMEGIVDSASCTSSVLGKSTTLDIGFDSGEKKCSRCSTGSPNASLPINNTKKERTLDALIRIKGKAVTESLNYDVLSAPSQVLDAEALGLSSLLCNDLATVISSPRYQMLSWVQDWPELLSICESYLASGGEMKTQTKELKFLNIDYNIFKDWPQVVESEMYAGIEKGYEQCIDPSDDYYIPQKKSALESDSSDSILGCKKKKRRRTSRKNSTDLSNEFKKKRKTKTSIFKDMYPMVSDTDTGTQDSALNTDSLGSDIFQAQKMKKSLKSVRITKTKTQRKIVENDSSQGMTNDSSRDGITSDVSNNEEFMSNVSNSNQHSNLSLLRKVSDPFVVKTLRMFRRKPNHDLSPSIINSTESSMINNNNCEHLSHELTDTKSYIVNARNDGEPLLDSPKNDLIKHVNSSVEINSKFSDRFIHNNVNAKNISNDLLTRDNLCKTVPGLNSLDMIIPGICLQPTVQIVQLPNNWNQANTSVPNPSILSSLLPQQSNAVQTTCATTSSDQNKSNTTSSTANTSNSASSSQVQTSLNSSPQSQSSSSTNTSVSSNSFLEQGNAPMTGAFSHLVSNAQTVSTAKTSQGHTFSNRSKLFRTTPAVSVSTSEPSHIVSHAASRTNTGALPMSSTTVNIATQVIRPVSSSQCEMTSTTASHRNNVTHMQRIGQSLISYSPRNLNMAQPGGSVDATKLQTNTLVRSESPSKQPPLETAVKYIYKDVKLIQTQDKKPNSPEDIQSASPANKKIVQLQTFSSEQLAKIIEKNCGSSKEKSESNDSLGFSQIASLPKFQQAFGKTMYQTSSSSITAQTNPNSESSGVTEYTVAGHTPETSTTSSTISNLCTVLSKAVQTSNKETNDPKTIKSNQKNVLDQNFKTDHSNLKLTQSIRTVQTVVSSNIQPTRIVTSQSKSQERSGMIQTSNSSVIFPCKVTTGTIATAGSIIQRKQVAILKTATIPTEKSSQTKIETENRSKESVIHSNMNALLTAALQNTSLHNTTTSTAVTAKITSVSPGCITKTVFDAEKKKPEMSVQTILPVANVHRVALPTSMQKNVRRQPVLSPTKFSRPVVQLTTISGQTQTPSATTPSSPLNRSVQSVLTPTSRNDSHLSHTISETSVSSKTLEQLREFESVLEQVTNTSQMKERNVQPQSTIEPLAQPILQISAQTSTNTTDFTNTTSSQSPNTYQSQSPSTNSSVHDMHGERVSLTFIGQTPSISSISDEKITSRTPIVLVQNCSRLLTSPAPSSSSPSPSSSSVNSSTSKLSIKSNKTAKSKSTSKSNPTTATLKVSTLQKPQQKPQEDEQTTQRIYAILDKYAEQLRNSPELKNKPAPRRRSNPPTNPSPTSKRKKSTQTKSKLPSQQASCSSSGMEMSPGSEDLRTMGSEDSSNGVSQISQVLNSPPSRLDEPSTPTGGDLSSETSESLDSKEPRVQHRVLLTETPVQNRAVLVQDNIQSTVINVEGKVLTTRKQVVVGGPTAMHLLPLSNVPGSTVRQLYFPVQSANVEGRLSVVTKVPQKMYRIVSGSPLLTFQPMCVNKQNSGVKQVKNAVVSGISSQSLTGVSAQPAVVLPPDGQFTLSSEGNISLDNTILINTTSASSISFLHRSVQSNFSAQDASVPRLVTTTAASITTSSVSSNSIQESSSATTYQSSADLPVSCLKPDSLLSICTSNVNLVRQEDKGKQTEDKILETDFRSDPGTDDTDTNQPSDDKNWALISVEKSLQSPPQSVNSDKVLEFKVTNDSPVESFGFQTPNLQNNQGKPFAVCKTDPKEQISPCKSIEGSKCFILKKESPKHETDDDNTSSDSTSSGRAKQDKQANEKRNNCSTETRGLCDSSWRYSVSGKPSSPKEQSTDNQRAVEIDTDADSHRRNNHASPTRSRRYQRTGSDVENTIYQMAFRRSDRLRASRKPREPIDSRTVSSLEGELRLQKSLSEECEDLGVDEPSTSDLFPEAELLLDPDPSSRDSSAQLPAVFSRSFDSASISSSPPSSRSISPKRQRLSSGDGGSIASTGCTSDDSKGANASSHKSLRAVAELSSAWDDESVSLHLDDDMSAAAVEPGSPTFVGISNPAASAPFTYSNSRSRFKSKMDKDEGDSDVSEVDDKCATSTTDEEMLSESDYHHVLTSNGLPAQKAEEKVRLRSRPSLGLGSTCGGGTLSRRSSLRGHVKKGCPCCNGSPERPKRRKDGSGSPLSLSFKRATTAAASNQPLDKSSLAKINAIKKR